METILTHVIQTGSYLIPFLIVLSIVVFVHEFGHFWVARRCGVKIETFSIGFGKEIFSWMDRKGTKWRVAWIPFGGYVQMFGDADPSSFGPSEESKKMSEEDRKLAFFAKPLWKRFSIVLAGPGANYAFGIVALAFLFVVNGQPYTPPVANEIVPDSAAQMAGLQAGDKILSIDETKTESFEQIKQIIVMNTGTPVTVSFDRGGVVQQLTLTPKLVRSSDRLGFEHLSAQLGIISTESARRELGLGAAIIQAFVETWKITVSTLKGVGQMVLGIRGTDELGGPLRIAEMSGKVAQDGVFALLWFIVIISINLGLINLFPIPLLDGGHLLFYLLEGVRGRPVSERFQEYGARAGAAFVAFLMIFATWNDLVHLRVFSYLSELFS